MQGDVGEDEASSEQSGGCRFDPPLYRQRYHHVAQILQRLEVKSVADLGCSVPKVISVLKNVPSVEQIMAVDVDVEAVTGRRGLYQPLLSDYLKRRSSPLTVTLFTGDIQSYDARLAGVEAITMIEVVEHLYPDILESVSTNVFTNLRPRVLIVTTPNYEYNIVFGSSTGFRHWDHKFEWTREQFQKWCHDLASKHDYDVTFSGVGEPPESMPHVGFCSQVATFQLRDEWTASVRYDTRKETPYKMVDECIHPYENIRLSEVDKISAETTYFLHTLARQLQDSNYPEDSMQCYIDMELNALCVTPHYLHKFPSIQKLCPDVQNLISILLEQGFSLTEANSHVLYELTPSHDSSHSSVEHYDEEIEVSSQHSQSDQSDWDI